MIFWRKIVIFHTKYPNKFRASLRSAQFFLVRPPLTWKPGSAPAYGSFLHNRTNKIRVIIDNFSDEMTCGICSMMIKVNRHSLQMQSVRAVIQNKSRGGSRGAHPAAGCAPLKLEKIWFFGVKSWFFTRNTPKIFAPPSARRNIFKCAPP